MLAGHRVVLPSRTPSKRKGYTQHPRGRGRPRPNEGQAPLRSALVLAGLLSILAVAPVRAEAEEVEAYASLPELVRAADAVVLGQVISAEKGRSFGGCGYTSAILRVDEVLAGTVPPQSSMVTLEYFGGCGPEIPQLGREIPADRGVFFLRNKGVDLRKFQAGATQAEIEAEAGFWRLAIAAGSAVDAAGRVGVPITANAPFLEAFEGRPFAELIDAVRSVSPHVRAGPAPSEPLSVASVVGFIVMVMAVILLIAGVAWSMKRSAP